MPGLRLKPYRSYLLFFSGQFSQASVLGSIFHFYVHNRWHSWTPTWSAILCGTLAIAMEMSLFAINFYAEPVLSVRHPLRWSYIFLTNSLTYATVRSAWAVFSGSQPFWEVRALWSWTGAIWREIYAFIFGIASASLARAYWWFSFATFPWSSVTCAVISNVTMTSTSGAMHSATVTCPASLAGVYVACSL